ncbi:MAG: S-layer homology domain-containing protein [Oscillibacter sp.]|nr:S-layer homology domain-containing protein [Oscillibacter sp.]
MKKFLSLVLALVMAMSLVTLASAKDFTDDSSITYKEAVDVISELGIVGGYSNGSFSPKGTLTRGAAAKIISNLILGPTDADALPTNVSPFKDVPAGSTFAGYISFCSSEGIISGYADGTFKPAGELSGYAFMKMLLGALGYDQATEGYTGANWKVNVAKRAMNIGLDDDLEGAFNGSKALTREEACLYALNTLKADMVDYDDSTTISINDVTIKSNSKAKEIEVRNDTGKIANDGIQQFAEKYFKDLKLTETKDDFGRPADKWTIKSKEVGTYNNSADASYAKNVKAEDVYADLGLSDDQDFVVYVDGKKLDKKINIDDVDKKLSKLYDGTTFGNGIIVEFFYDDSDSDDIDARMIVINPVFGEVDKIKNDGKSDRAIVIDGMEYETQSFEDGDKVIYTVADGDIQDVVAAEKQTGKVTKTVGDDLYIDGDKYQLSASSGADNKTVKAKDEVKFYLDTTGYIISISAEDSTDVDDLAYVQSANSDRTDYAKLIFSDGTKKTVDTDEKYTDLKGKIVSYDIDDGEYELKDKTTISASDTIDYTKGDATMKVGSDKIKVNSKTVFVYNEKDDDGKDSLKVYTGFKSAPSIKGDVTVAARCEDGKASKAAVFVYVEIAADAGVGSSDDLTFIAVKSKPKAIDDGDLDVYYELPAIVDGKITTLMVKTDVTEIEDIAKNGGVVVYKDITTNSDDQVKKGTAAAEKDDFYTATAVKKAKNDVITLDDVGYGYTDDVKVFFVNSDLDEITSKSISSIKDNSDAEDKYSAVYFTLDDDEIDLIVVVEAE